MQQIVAFAEGFDPVAIDETQQIPGIGLWLKIQADHLPDLQIIADGSLSFDLAGAVAEPLTGRKYTLTLFPISQMELKQECKWAPKPRVKPQKKWLESYPGTTFELVTPDNYLDFA